MSEKNDKWTMFKNYIHNELGITKDDIRAWLKEAVQSQAELMLKKTFDDFDMDTFVRRHQLKIVACYTDWLVDKLLHKDFIYSQNPRTNYSILLKGCRLYSLLF